MDDFISLGNELGDLANGEHVYVKDAGVWYHYEYKSQYLGHTEIPEERPLTWDNLANFEGTKIKDAFRHTHCRWVPDVNEYEITRLAEEMIAKGLRDHREGPANTHYRSAAGRVEYVVKRARSHESVEVVMGDLDADGNAINTPEGYFWTAPGDDDWNREESSFGHYSTKLTKVSPADKWVGGVWEEFLDLVVPDLDDQLALQRMTAYVLLGDRQDKAVFFLHGETNRGKSLFLNAIENALGDYAITTGTDVWLKNNKNDYSKADLPGKRLISCAEFDEDMKINTSLLKTFTGGEMDEARRIYGSPFRYKPQGTIVISTNKMPFLGSDAAAWARTYMMPFTGPEVGTHKFSWEATSKKPLRNVLLSDDVAAEILRWMMDGLWYYNKEGINWPEANVNVLNLERADQRHHVEKWFDECLEEGVAWTPSKKLFEEYRMWAQFTENVAPGKILTATGFGRKLRAAGFTSQKNSSGNMEWNVSLITKK